MNDTDEYLLIADAAKVMGVSVSRLHQLRYENRGPVSVKVHNRIQYRREDIEHYMAASLDATRRGGVL